MQDAATLFRLLGDEARLRLLRLLAKERLNVSELTQILGLAQSGVSRHLGLLRDAGLVGEEREGGFTYYRVLTHGTNGALAGVWDALQRHFDERASDEMAREDDARLQEVMRIRRETVEMHGGADGSEARQIVPGRSWIAWARALGLLMPPLTVADLGCGEGLLTLETAAWARQVIAVDRSARVLERARDQARRRRVTNVAWKLGEIERLPLASRSVDVALLSQALHHAEDPATALREAARILKPGGRLVVLDLREHDQRWVRERLGDRWLGFSDRALGGMMRDAGLRDVAVRVGAASAGDPFTVLIAVGTRSAKAGPS